MNRRRVTRAYKMGARAEAAAATHRAILDAAIRRFGEHFYDEVPIADVARDAGVTVQTVLRRFGSKDGLVEAATTLALEQVRRERWDSTPGDVDAAVRNLVAHYESWGDRSLRFLAQEQRVPAMRRVTDAGRALHHAWVDDAFAPRLSAVRGPARARLRARLIAATDVYVWKIFRRDLALGAEAAEVTIRELVRAVLA
jgi:AcrR family transcriptional regulator